MSKFIFLVMLSAFWVSLIPVIIKEWAKMWVN